MLARIRKARENESGFTLIELLVVMIIIGILAAIAIPVFLNQRTKARETSAKADVSTIGKEVAAYYVDGTDGLVAASTPGAWTLVTATGATPVTDGKLSGNNKVTDTNIASGTAYCIEMTSYSSAGGAPDQPWVFTQDGLKKGTAAVGSNCP